MNLPGQYPAHIAAAARQRKARVEQFEREERLSQQRKELVAMVSQSIDQHPETVGLPLFAQTETPLAESLKRVGAALKAPSALAGGIPTCDPNLTREEEPRLSGQNQKILDALRLGPVTNHALSAMGILKYTSRISDLRAAGHDVRIKSRDRKTGLVVYELKISS